MGHRTSVTAQVGSTVWQSAGWAFTVALLCPTGCGSGNPTATILRDERPTLGASVIDDNDKDAVGVTSQDEATGANIALDFNASAAFCCNPLTIVFDAMAVDGVDLRSLRIDWDFGDGRHTSGSSVEHTFPWVGEYVIALSATTSDGVAVLVERMLTLGVNGQGDFLSEMTPSVGTEGKLVVDAGPGGTARPGESVALAGRIIESAEDVKVDVRWEQTEGGRVTIEDAENLHARFTVPAELQSTQDFTFRLIATDGVNQAIDIVSFAVAVTALESERTLVAFDRRLTIVRDQSFAVTLAGEGPNSDELDFTIVTSPTNGDLATVVRLSSATVSALYTPDPGFVGSDSFSFRVTSDAGESDIATVDLFITAADESLEADSVARLVPMDSTVSVALGGRTSDTTPLSFEVVSAPANGVLGAIETASSKTALVTYTPTAGYRGPDSFQVAVSNGAQTVSQDVSLTMFKRFMPWVEFNEHPNLPAADFYTIQNGVQPGWTLMDYYVAGMNTWALVSPTVIVSTVRARIDDASLFPQLMQRKPTNVEIIGGIKTLHYIPGARPFDAAVYDFADTDAWAEIAAHATEVTAVTGNNIIVLENETATNPFHTGDGAIDVARLELALAPLAATGIEFWWFLPQVMYDLPEFPDRVEQSSRLVEAVKRALPNARFLPNYTGFAGWLGHRQIEPVRDKMIDMVGLARMNEVLYATPTGYIDDRYFYQPHEAIDAMRQVLPAQNTNIIYPGGAHWLTVGDAFANVLPPLARILSDQR